MMSYLMKKNCDFSPRERMKDFEREEDVEP